jgi:hypothetical protein
MTNNRKYTAFTKQQKEKKPDDFMIKKATG